MRTTHWTNITVEPGRHRQVFNEEKFRALKESIRKAGLIHLPVCREEDGKLILVAGERRLRAIAEIYKEYGTPIFYHHTQIELGHVPYALWEDLNTLAAREVELEENVSREDLTWQERTQAIADLHKLKTQLNPEWTLSDTGQITQDYLRPNVTFVREDLQLADNLYDEDVRKAATRQEAIKILKRKMEREFAAAIGERLVEQMPGCTVIQGNGIDLMHLEIRQESVDVFLTDPPYGINAQNFDAGLQVNHDYDDSPERISWLMTNFASVSFGAAKPQAHLYMFCDIRKFFELAELFARYDWSVWPRPMIWKKDVGHIPRPNYGPRLQYECILFANKGNKPVTGLYSDVLDHPAVTVKEHAAQKPTSLYVDLLRRSCVGGELVVDPFCGTGTIFAAAIQMGCAAVGFDTDPMAIGLSKETIRKCLEMKKTQALL